MQSNQVSTIATALAVISIAILFGSVHTADLHDVFRSSSIQRGEIGAATSSGSIAQPESEETITSADITKWKRGINLGRKMMCQIDHRNCRGFSEQEKRFYRKPKVNYNLVVDFIRSNMANPEFIQAIAESNGDK